VYDTEAHAERLWQLHLQRQRASRAVSGFGSVEVRAAAAVEATRSQPRQPKAQPTAPAKKPPAKKPPTKKPAAQPKPPQVKAAGNMQAVVNYALRQQGKPYRWASAGPDAFDCSGLLVASYRQIGVRLPHQSEQIRNRGKVVPRAQWYPGMALWRPGHVGIYLGGNKMIHASRPGRPVAVVTIYDSFTGLRLT
jgi:cell wall-associated NlpC family hydrolase